MPTFSGTFIVEPNDFPMRAQRFIIRDDEIAFDFRYKASHEAGEEFRSCPGMWCKSLASVAVTGG